MGTTLMVHIAAGGLGLITGFTALFAAKGATLHRRAGTVFVYAMLTMALAGMTVSVARGVASAVNVPAALVTACLAVTALTTLRTPSATTRWLDRGAMVVMLAVGLTCLTFAYEAFAAGGTRKGMPAFPFLLFGTVGLLAFAGDVRRMRAGGLRGTARLARHLWRMSFALFIAALSFFIGQQDELPEPLRIPALLALPVLAVLVTMFYWLWRVRVRRSFHGITGAGAAEAVAPRLRVLARVG